MKRSTRRNFLKQTLATTAVLGWSARSWSQVAGANERVNLATIGFRGRGSDHIDAMVKLAPEGVKYVALCDVDSKVLAGGVAAADKRGDKVEGFSDLRKMLEMKNLDAVTVATPNHWHALAAIWSIQAGKHVYVEKPVSHNVWEGRKIVEGARKYNRICQTGTQSRSSIAIRQAVEWVRSGNLGKIVVSRGLCYKPRNSIGLTEGPQKVPSEVEYDLWCGPAPVDPLRRTRLHYDWHWMWNYGNGDLGNQGIHQMDVARWFLGEDKLSPRVFSLGGRVGYKDDGETPNTQIVFHDYAAAPLIFEVRGLPSAKGVKTMDKYKGGSVAVICECENGYVTAGDGVKAYDPAGNEIKQWKGSENHFENFIQAVKSGSRAHQNADIWEGHLSSALCHTGNISYRLGGTMAQGEIRERIQGERGATQTFERMAQHLEANEVDLKATQLTLGPVLTMDPRTEKFIGNKAADALLTREYRAPFVVPEHV